MVFIVTLSGCLGVLSDGDPGVRAPFLVAGTVEYVRDDGDRESAGFMRVEGPAPQVDRFGTSHDMVPVHERIGDGAERVHWLLPDARRIEVSEQGSEGSQHLGFDQRGRVHGDQGILPFLLLIHDRPFDAQGRFAQWLFGYAYEVNVTWDGSSLRLNGTSAAHDLLVEYRFDGGGFGLRHLQTIRAVTATGDHVYTIMATPVPVAPLVLAPESDPPTTVWRAYPFERFLAEGGVGTHLPLQRVWEHLETDPRTSSWATRDPHLAAAYYRTETDGLGLQTDRWSVRVEMDDGRGIASVEQTAIGEQALVPLTTRVEEGPPGEAARPFEAWYSWQQVVENCAGHLKVEPGEVTMVEWGPPGFVTGLEYPHALRLKFRPIGDGFVVALCQFDPVGGLPISSSGHASDFVI